MTFESSRYHSLLINNQQVLIFVTGVCFQFYAGSYGWKDLFCSCIRFAFQNVSLLKYLCIRKQKLSSAKSDDLSLELRTTLQKIEWITPEVPKIDTLTTIFGIYSSNFVFVSEIVWPIVFVNGKKLILNFIVANSLSEFNSDQGVPWVFSSATPISNLPQILEERISGRGFSVFFGALKKNWDSLFWYSLRIVAW